LGATFVTAGLIDGVEFTTCGFVVTCGAGEGAAFGAGFGFGLGFGLGGGGAGSGAGDVVTGVVVVGGGSVRTRAGTAP